MIKCALTLRYGLMPGNLHYHCNTPNPESEGLRDGTLDVLPSVPYSALHLCKPPDCLPA